MKNRRGGRCKSVKPFSASIRLAAVPGADLSSFETFGFDVEPARIRAGKAFPAWHIPLLFRSVGM